MRYCEISAKRKDSDHHDIIDLTAFNTDGFDVTGQKTLGESALFAGCPILLTSENYFAGFDILMYSFTLFPKHLADYQTIWLAAFCRGNDANLDGNCRLKQYCNKIFPYREKISPQK